MQSQVVCSGCRILLMCPAGATNVCCALCNAMTTVSPPGMEMAQLICGGCHTLLMYTCGATSVRRSCCHTVSLAPGWRSNTCECSTLPLCGCSAQSSPNIAHVNCGNCQATLMYPYGAPSVKCAVCQYITNVNMGNVRVPIPMHRSVGPPSSAPLPSDSAPFPNSQSQTVVVENPLSVDKTGKLVSNVVVGVITDRK